MEELQKEKGEEGLLSQQFASCMVVVVFFISLNFIIFFTFYLQRIFSGPAM